MFTDIIQAIFNFKDSIFQGMMGLFLSPFARMEQLAIDNETMSMLKWIFPLGEVAVLLESWCLAIAAWYMFKYTKNHIKNALEGIVGTSTITPQ